jgi:type II secretory pathway pseudopilin PulG
MKLKWPKSILWLGSKESSPYAHLIIVVLVLVLLIVALQMSYDTRCDRRIRATIGHLKALRNAMNVYFRMYGQYPDSLNEFQQWAKGGKHSGFWDKMYVDLTSGKQIDIPVYRELNNKGGYYYDPNTGEIRLNLTRPVKGYLKWYGGCYKNKVPSSW